MSVPIPLKKIALVTEANQGIRQQCRRGRPNFEQQFPCDRAGLPRKLSRQRGRNSRDASAIAKGLQFQVCT